jgi:hypothetical protein
MTFFSTYGAGSGSSIKELNLLRPTNENFYIIIKDNTSSYTNALAGSTTSGDTNICDDLWHHVAMVVDGTSWKIYIDGGDAAINASNTSNSSGPAFSGTSTVSFVGSTRQIYLGKNGIASSYFWDGKYDEVAFIRSALSDTQIRAIYNGGTPTSLSAYSPFQWLRMGDNDSGSGTTITDQGSGGNDATLNNGPTFSTDIPLAPLVLPSITNTYSVEFDGTNDYMSISDADIFSLGNGSGTDNAFSISGWIYPPVGDGQQTFYVATKDASGNREWAFRTVAGKLHFFVFGTGGGYIGRNYSTGLTNAQWLHVAMTYDGSKASSGIKLYLDGTRVDDGDYASGTYTAAKNTSAEVRVSALQVNNTYSDGIIDELSIFNTELSASDITAIYNSGTPNDISSLNPVGWWRMGDNNSGSGTTITDQGSGSNDGTLVNGPTFSTNVPS